MRATRRMRQLRTTAKMRRAARAKFLYTPGPWTVTYLHGALGDGVTNDTAAVQLALTTCAAAQPPRGEIWLLQDGVRVGRIINVTP